MCWCCKKNEQDLTDSQMLAGKWKDELVSVIMQNIEIKLDKTA